MARQAAYAPPPVGARRNLWRPGSPLRLNLGFLVAVYLPIAFIAARSGRAWLEMLGWGSLIALVPLFIAMLGYKVLKHIGQLRIWWAVLIGAAAAALPVMAVSLLPLGSDYSFGFEGEWLVVDGVFTWAGIWQFFVLQPAMFGAIGAACGLACWLVAFGMRLAAPEPPTESGA